MRRAPAPLIIDAAHRPKVLPALPLFKAAREGRQLYVHTRQIYLRGPDGWWDRIPYGYVTDWASIPGLATVLTLTELQPTGAHAVAADGHDWRYAVGEPGRKADADRLFRAEMKLDGVPAWRREVMYQAVRLGGGPAYANAARYWESANFADPVTGAYPVAPPFARQDAFVGGRWGRRAAPDWDV